MKLKKILAAAAAAAIAVSTMAVNVFAAEVEGPSKEFTVSVNDDTEKGMLAISGSDIPAGTTEIKFDISFSGDGTYGGGAIGRNVGGAWKQDDTNFSNDKPETHHITINATEIDKDPDSNGNTGLQVQCWWVGGGTMTVKTTFITDDSAAPAEDEAAPAEDTAEDEDDAAPAEDTADDEEDVNEPEADEKADHSEEKPAAKKPADKKPAPADAGDAAADNTTADSTPDADSNTTSTKTGNVSAAAMVSVMALAGVAAVAAKKRK